MLPTTRHKLGALSPAIYLPPTTPHFTAPPPVARRAPPQLFTRPSFLHPTFGPGLTPPPPGVAPAPAGMVSRAPLPPAGQAQAPASASSASAAPLQPAASASSYDTGYADGESPGLDSTDSAPPDPPPASPDSSTPVAAAPALIAHGPRWPYLVAAAAWLLLP